MKIKIWQILSVIICIILGVLLHFAYEWSGGKAIVGLFSAVNESIWEHIKLIFYPTALMAIIGYFVIGKRTDNYWFGQTIGVITAIFVTIIFFYTYTGVIGKNIDWLNIAIFVIAILLGGYTTYRILNSENTYNAEYVSIIFLIILLLSFIVYTINPPKVGLFKDPITGTYGIKN